MTASTIQFDAAIGSALREAATRALEEMGLEDVTSARVLSGGGSNQNVLLECNEGQVVLRIAESDVERFRIDRIRGEQGHRLAAAAGVAPELLAALPCGHCATRFIAGRVVDAQLMREPGILQQMGESLRRLHDAGEIAGSYSVFEELRCWVDIARREHLALPADFDELMAAADRVDAVFAALELTAKLCHNDLQLQNFIEACGRLWLLDFEYAGMGNPYFDLGMLFANGELIAEEEDVLLTSYFDVLRESDRARARLLALISAMRDAIWAVIAAPVKHDLYDYGAWSREYFERSRRLVAGDAFADALKSV